MKKIFELLVLVLLITLTNSGIASAAISKNFYGYQVKNINIRQLSYEIDRAIEAYEGNDKFTPCKTMQQCK